MSPAPEGRESDRNHFSPRSVIPLPPELGSFQGLQERGAQRGFASSTELFLISCPGPLPGTDGRTHTRTHARTHTHLRGPRRNEWQRVASKTHWKLKREEKSVSVDAQSAPSSQPTPLELKSEGFLFVNGIIFLSSLESHLLLIFLNKFSMRPAALQGFYCY